MNNLLSNRLINSIAAYGSATLIFIVALLLAGSIGMFIMSLLVVFISGGFALKVLEWFDSKVVKK